MSSTKTARRRPAGQLSTALPVFILSVAVASVFVGLTALAYRPAVPVFFGLMAILGVLVVGLRIRDSVELHNLRKRGFNL